MRATMTAREKAGGDEKFSGGLSQAYDAVKKRAAEEKTGRGWSWGWELEAIADGNANNIDEVK